MTSQQIRQQFLDFFASKGHAFVPSSPVVPHDDPTLMFTNAGMNQFKPIFLGAARPDHPRVANSQKCIRAGGKHNDLDDVGQDTYHHTFFEMLGNWSFGDYFKKEAIEWAWELLTKVWGIDRSCLHATYFGGQRKGTEARRHEGTEGQQEVQSSKIEVRNSDFELRTWELEPDYEARDLWLSVTDIDPSHVHPGSMKDNFWEMGETGPCGPCSEIHIDLTPDKSGRELVNEGDARVIELWNLVFIQFNRAGDGKLTPLPAKHVDTGMGFERLCAVLQGKKSNYDTDVFAPIFDAVRKRTGAFDYGGTLPGGGPIGHAPTTFIHQQIMLDVSYRVIADHLRCLVFALTDGAMPDNSDRGSILRSILRRAVRYGREYMNMHEPFLCDLVPTVIDHMGDVFPELRNSAFYGTRNVERLTEIIRDEETAFFRTLDQANKPWWSIVGETFYRQVTNEGRYVPHRLQGFDRNDPYQTTIRISEFLGPFIDEFKVPELTKERVAKWCKKSPGISGADAFKLHDTHGLPIDVVNQKASELGFTIDVSEFEHLMDEARERARGAGTQRVFHNIARLAGPCDDSAKYLFPPLCETLIQTHSGQTDDSGTFHIQFVPAHTCFYAEQGGQVSDVGWVRTRGGEGRITEVVRSGQTILHTAVTSRGHITAGRCVLEVDVRHRWPTMQNHTSTHILNWALRKVLEIEGQGDRINQRGSLVDPEKTRFDFSHNKQLSENELAKIEQHVQSQISNALPVLTNPHVEQKKAREINTLRAVFGEKYPDRVRVVSIGADIDAMLRDPKNPKWMQYSVEFCGGTHLKNSKEAEEFVLVHEEAVAKGVRRLVGLTGEKAKEARQRGEFFLEVSGKLRTEVQSSKFKVQKGADPHGGPYDLTRLLRELSEATIPLLTRHRLAEQIAVLQESAKEHEKKAAATAQRGAVEAVGDLLAAHAIDVNGVTIVVGAVPAGHADALRSGIDYVRNKRGSSAVLLATVENGKVTLVAGMSRDVVDRGVKAGDLIKEICSLVGGRGGGRPDMAQGGGNDPKGLPKALDRAREWLGEKLS
jgi:alanyl-tRNA synthetase